MHSKIHIPAEGGRNAAAFGFFVRFFGASFPKSAEKICKTMKNQKKAFRQGIQNKRKPVQKNGDFDRIFQKILQSFHCAEVYGVVC